jgi:hypothetical protein
MLLPYYTDTQISKVVTQNAHNLLYQVPRKLILGKGKVTPVEEGLKRNNAHGPIVEFCSPVSKNSQASTCYTGEEKIKIEVR